MTDQTNLVVTEAYRYCRESRDCASISIIRALIREIRASEDRLVRAHKERQRALDRARDLEAASGGGYPPW